MPLFMSIPDNAKYDLALLRTLGDLNARISALQMVIEQMLGEMGGKEFSREVFRKHLAEMQEACREHELLQLEKTNPLVAALLDERGPAEGMSPAGEV